MDKASIHDSVPPTTATSVYPCRIERKALPIEWADAEHASPCVKVDPNIPYLDDISYDAALGKIDGTNRGDSLVFRRRRCWS